ncbi:MAG: ribonuclease protein subunit [Methanothermococcus sp.]|jgi:ribonuclease P/MRP protein subunit POP5|uniref:Rpp14/Pop5 family protein n=1 Tax=Methanothermococcus TaxID=155862 RepID=UPI0003747C69|nr:MULTISPECIES: Rpp14/Pop5 family protein [Methanothermococcus]MDK2790916.1 ribonuclease protein subunit [Methanothermococcus sp.]MDK2988438.1 ribonuclease protein subunit [Methanothermococcus sp.]
MLKTLPPTLREKKRYIGFEIIYQNELSSNEVVGIVRNAIINYYGAWGCSKANPWLIDYTHPKGILRVSRDEVDYVKASLILLSEYRHLPINIRILGVSGSIKKVRAKFLKVPHEEYYKVIQRIKRKRKGDQ